MNFSSHFQYDMRRPAANFEALDGKCSTANFHMPPPMISSERPGTRIEATDVLCGRGKTSFNHVGNRRFRDLIAASTDKYDSAKSRLEKSMVVHFIVEEVKKIKGRFLKQDRFSGKWYELDERQAKEKVGHAIRDATSSIDPKKKGLKKSRSNSSSTSAASKTKNSPFQNQQQASLIGAEMSFYVSPENPSCNMMVYTTESMDESAKSFDRMDDLEPLNVDSPEAQNSMTELQRDSSFLHRLSVSLVEPSGSVETEGSSYRNPRPFRYQVR